FTHPPPPHSHALSLHAALPISLSGQLACLPLGQVHGWGSGLRAIIFLSTVGETQRSIMAAIDREGQHDAPVAPGAARRHVPEKKDRKSTRLNSSHVSISYAVFC